MCWHLDYVGAAELVEVVAVPVLQTAVAIEVVVGVALQVVDLVGIDRGKGDTDCSGLMVHLDKFGWTGIRDRRVAPEQVRLDLIVVGGSIRRMVGATYLCPGNKQIGKDFVNPVKLCREGGHLGST